MTPFKSILFFLLYSGFLFMNCSTENNTPTSKEMSRTNTDESKVPDYVLPKLLTAPNGKTIASTGDWEKQRRSEILQLFEQEVYGKVPEAHSAINVTTKEKILNPKALMGKATLKEITFTFSKDDKSLEATLLLFLPNLVEGPAPVFLGYNFDGNHTVFPDESIALPNAWVPDIKRFGVTEHQATPISRGAKFYRWPVLNIINRGYGLATMYYGEIDPDFDDDFKNGIHQFFDQPIPPDGWGSIATWAWALSGIMDHFEKDNSIDHNRVAVIGHSRLGKAALWAGALDERFAMIISNNSGCGGAALSSRRFGETISAINTQFPHWFCDRFNHYNDNEKELPFDQHMLIALAAPRPIYVTSAESDSWADPKGEFLAAKHASEVYGLYGLKGLEGNELPPVDQPIKTGHIGYHIRTGSHDMTFYDWEQFLDFADLHLSSEKD